LHSQIHKHGGLDQLEMGAAPASAASTSSSAKVTFFLFLFAVLCLFYLSFPLFLVFVG